MSRIRESNGQRLLWRPGTRWPRVAKQILRHGAAGWMRAAAATVSPESVPMAAADVKEPQSEVDALRANSTR